MGRATGAPAAVAAADMAPGTSPARPSGAACWLGGLIAFNEELRRLFIRRAPDTTIPPGERIRAIVASHFGISIAEICGGDSARRCAWPRQVAMYICANQASLASPSIARLFGDRDPSTVLYALRAVAARAAKDPGLEREIAKLTVTCRRGGRA